MSDLQLSLLAAGAVVIAAVYLFNRWQERQFRRRTEQAFARPSSDVLDDEAAASQQPTAQRIEPRMQASPEEVAEVAPLPPVAAGKIDQAIDYVVEVSLKDAADGAELHRELCALTAAWGKPVLVEGLDAVSGEWQGTGMSRGLASTRLRFALQLSNRAGCVQQTELGAFWETVSQWAARNAGEAESLDVAAAHAMAVEIDRFCAEVDIAIGVNVVTRAGEPFSGTKIRTLAQARGLTLDADGLFYARSEQGEVLYTLDNHEPMPFMPEQLKTLFTTGVTFLLDVPRVAHALDAFDAMLGTARGFAADLDGTLVDDNRAPLSESAIAKIRAQLESVLAKMEAAKLPAGGARALRLFS